MIFLRPWSFRVPELYEAPASEDPEERGRSVTALVRFALDSSHGYERTHIDSLTTLSRLLVLYMQNRPLFERDTEALVPIGDLPAADAAPPHA